MIDAYARRVLGWRCSTRMATPLVLDAIEQAIWTRERESMTDLTGLIHRNDRSSQYTSMGFTDRLLQVGIDVSFGATGSSYDNALAATINGLYKTELIHPQSPGRRSKRSRSRRSSGPTGSTTAALRSTATTSHPSSSSRLLPSK